MPRHGNCSCFEGCCDLYPVTCHASNYVPPDTAAGTMTRGVLLCLWCLSQNVRWGFGELICLIWSIFLLLSRKTPGSAGYLHFERQWCVLWAWLAVLCAPAVAWAVLWRQKAVGHLFLPPALLPVVNYQWPV